MNIQTATDAVKNNKGKSALAAGGGLTLAGVLMFCPTKGEVQARLDAERQLRCDSHQFVQKQLDDLGQEVKDEMREVRSDIKRLMLRSPKDAWRGDTTNVLTVESISEILTP